MPDPCAHDGTSVAGTRHWRHVFVFAFVLLLAIKLVIACTLAPFGDEAFYWQESRHLAWGYSDLPPLTAWLIRLGEEVAGHGLVGLRWPFLLIGSSLPWLLVRFARAAFGDERLAWQAGLLCLVLPLAGSLGILAIPDVPLTVAALLAMDALLRAMRDNLRGHWLLLGLWLAVAWLSHYRAAMLMLAGLALLLITKRGRAQWRRGGFWWAMGVAALGLLPLIIANFQLHGAGIAFQLVQRNAWGLHWDALVQPLEQALACTPLLYGWLCWAAWSSWRRRDRGLSWNVVGVIGLSFSLLYFGFGLLGDALRFRAHWPLPGYLPLLVSLPILWQPLWQSPRWRRLLLTTVFLAGSGELAGLSYLGLAASASGTAWLSGIKAFPSNFVGWRESATQTKQVLTDHPELLVADNFKLAAELDFQFDGARPIYVLDNPLNTKHGRAPQLAYWQRDEAALRQDHPQAGILLVVEETALHEKERGAWLDSICDRVPEVRPLTRLDLFGRRKRFAFYAARVASTTKPTGAVSHCAIAAADTSD